MRAIALLLGLALAGLAPAAARAYVTMKVSGTGIELRWTSLPMKFNIHQSAAPGVSAADTQAAVRAAYKTWSSVACSYYKSQDLGVVNMAWGDKNDHINTNVVTPSWPSSYGQTALGITWTSYDPSAGKILDADTHYNPNYTWAVNGSAFAIDIQAVATHEIGHQLGLDHSSVQDATMFYATGQGNTSQRSLHSDDISGLCHLYPSGQPQPPECTTSAQCAPSETCTGGKCVAGAKKGYGSPCNDGSECTSTICLQYGSNTFCSQLCDTTACPNGDQCLPLSGGGKGCLPNSSSMGSKTLGQTCQTNLDCKSQICVSVPGKGYLCSQRCDLTQKNCPYGFTCVNSTGGGLCIPAATTTKKKLGESCTGPADCESGLCAGTSSGNVCVTLCDKANPSSCPTGYVCVSAGTKSVCIKSSGPQPPKPGELGATCTKSDECKSKLCVDDGQGKLYCTILCDPASAVCGEFYECVPAGTNRYACAPRAAEDGDSSGCGVATHRSAPLPGGVIFLGLLLLVLGVARRR